MSYDHNDLYDAFEAGYLEGWQFNGGEVGYIRGAFEDWLHNRPQPEAAAPNEER